MVTPEPGKRSRISANLVHLRVAERARAALAEAHIPCLFLKGVAFLDTLYPDPSTRILGDVDLLVPVANRSALDAALAPAGFARVPPPATHPHSWETHYNWMYRSAEGTAVEVHTALCPAGLFAIDLPGLWERAVEHRVARRPIPTLGPEDSLLALAIHEAKHGYGVPRQSRVDVCRMIETWPPDWDVVVDRATAWGATAAVYVTLTASRACGAAVPERVLHDLAPDRIHASVIECAVRLPEGRPRWPVDRVWARAATMLVMTDHWRHRLQFALAYGRRRASDVVALALQRDVNTGGES